MPATREGIPVEVVRMPQGSAVTADVLWQYANSGALFIGSGAAQNTTVTGQTSFANTTPTFAVDVPPGQVIVPIFLNLVQTGSVAGGAIDVLVEIDSGVKRVTSGSAEKLFNPRVTKGRGTGVTFKSTVTAVAGSGITPWRATIGQDVSTAEGAANGVFWKPEMPYLIEGPGAWLVYTYAAVTGPTWYYSLGFATLTPDELKAFNR